jgi:hypothetical protein
VVVRNLVQVVIAVGDGVEGVSAERSEIQAEERGSEKTREARLHLASSVCLKVIKSERGSAYCSRGAQVTTIAFAFTRGVFM